MGKELSRRYLFNRGHGWVTGYSLLQLVNGDNRN